MTSRLLLLLLMFPVIAAPASTSATAWAALPVRPAIAAAQSDTAVIPRDSIRDAADRVMKQHDYRSVRRRMLEQIPDQSDADGGFLMNLLGSIGDAIGSFLEWLFAGLFSPRNTVPAAPPQQTSTPASTGGGIDFSFAHLLLFVGLAVLLVLVMWIIATVVKTSDGRRRLDCDGLFGDDEDPANLSIPPGELAASTYEGRAIQMARDGNFRSAIRELLIGSMSWIERAGLIRYRKGLTNRDYVRAVWRQLERREAYIETAITFERVYFGRREATAEMFRDCLSSFQSSFREEETTTTV